MKSNFSVRSICMCALFAALVAAGAFLRIPLPLIPFTLQTLFIMLAGMLLGKRYAAISCAVYVILGLIGLPIFTQGGGIGYVLKPTFGYLIGFIPGAYIIGALSEKQSSFVKMFLACLAGLAVIYILGTVYYYLLASLYLKKTVVVSVMLASCVFTTLPGDLILAVLASLLSKRLKGKLKV